MSDAIHDWIISLGLSPLNTILLVVLALVARQKIIQLMDDVSCCRRRNERIERSLIRIGIKLLPLDEE